MKVRNLLGVCTKQERRHRLDDFPVDDGRYHITCDRHNSPDGRLVQILCKNGCNERIEYGRYMYLLGYVDSKKEEEEKSGFWARVWKSRKK